MECIIIGFLRVPGCQRGGGVPGEKMGIPEGKIWELTTPLRILLHKLQLRPV